MNTSIKARFAMLLPYQPDRSSVFQPILGDSKEANDTIHVVFVDPFFSNEKLIQRLRDENIKMSAVYTLINDTDGVIDSSQFDEVFYIKNSQDLPFIAEQLKAKQVSGIYAASKFSIHTTDLLSNLVTPTYANTMSSSYMRTNKADLQQQMAFIGIKPVKQIDVMQKLKLSEELELMSWKFPVIIKHNNNLFRSPASICYSIHEIKQYLNERLALPLQGQYKSSYLIQEFLEGAEVAVMTYSKKGIHHVSHIKLIQNVVSGNKITPLYVDYLPLQQKISYVCIEYVNKILDSLALKNGFSETTIILTAIGPQVINVDTTFCDKKADNRSIMNRCHLNSPVDLLIQNYKNLMPKQHKIIFAREVYLYTNIERRINALNVALLHTLPSYCEANMSKIAGSVVDSQLNGDSVATVTLVHQDKDQLENDYQKILDWENNWELF